MRAAESALRHSRNALTLGKQPYGKTASQIMKVLNTVVYDG